MDYHKITFIEAMRVIDADRPTFGNRQPPDRVTMPSGHLALSVRVVNVGGKVGHAGVALHSAVCVDSGILFATSFGRVVSARWYAQRRQGAFDGLVAEPCV